MHPRGIYQVGDLVEPSLTYSDHTLGVVTGVNRYGSDCNSYDIQWAGQPILEAWSPKEMRLVAREIKINNENKETNRSQNKKG